MATENPDDRPESLPASRRLMLQSLQRKRAELETRVGTLAAKRAEEQQSAHLASDEEEQHVSLAYFAQANIMDKLDPWQLDLCDRVQEALEYAGPRFILIHAPPQKGKSVIISQRTPAYTLGRWPDKRVKVVMHNIKHAIEKSSKVVQNIMRRSTYKRIFPDVRSQIPKLTSQADFSTFARLAKGDGQPSMAALGLQTGFVGEGVDVLFIDDPYASAREAQSEAYNQLIDSFWTETASQRISENGKVFVMFHRYGVHDFAGRRLLAEPDKWEMWRYPAIADEPYKIEETGKTYPALPLNRPKGARLSARYSWRHYEEKKQDPDTWNGQHQGRPIVDTGEFFDMSIMTTLDMFVDEWDVPRNLKRIRAWDFAATEGGGAFSVGVKMAGPDKYGIIYILDSQAKQLGTLNRMKLIEQLAKLDGPTVEVGYPVDPGSAGIDTAFFTSALALPNTEQWTFPARQNKVTRAQGLQLAWNSGRIRLVRNREWNPKFLRIFRQFPKGTLKDEVDATAEGYKRLMQESILNQDSQNNVSTSQSLYY